MPEIKNDDSILLDQQSHRKIAFNLLRENLLGNIRCGASMPDHIHELIGRLIEIRCVFPQSSHETKAYDIVIVKIKGTRWHSNNQTISFTVEGGRTASDAIDRVWFNPQIKMWKLDYIEFECGDDHTKTMTYRNLPAQIILL